MTREAKRGKIEYAALYMKSRKSKIQVTCNEQEWEETVVPVFKVFIIWDARLQPGKGQDRQELKQDGGDFKTVCRLIHNCNGQMMTKQMFTSPLNKIIELSHDKTNKMTVRQAKTQINLGIRPV